MNGGATMMTANSGYAFISHSQTSYPSQQPSIDNMQLARRKRRRTSPRELNMLEQEFARSARPHKAERVRIARSVGMSEKAVQIWFQNKRQAARKQSQRGQSFSTTEDFKRGMNKDGYAHSHTSDENDNNNNNNNNATVAHRSSSTPVYRDRPTKVDKSKKVCLSMSEDGKASVITAKRTPQKNRIKTPTGPLSPVKSSKLNQMVDSSPTAKEKECISNLLSLRGAVWE